MELGFRPEEKAEHQGCCGRIMPESGRNRNPALDSSPPKKWNENKNAPPCSTVAVLTMLRTIFRLAPSLFAGGVPIFKTP